MLVKTAYELINIKSSVNYLDSIKNDGPIFRIHCTRTNESEVEIESYKGDSVKFPIGSFICGAVYDIMIKRMIFDENKCGFIGYKLKDKPLNMRN